jgi:hypothetical protein
LIVFLSPDKPANLLPYLFAGRKKDGDISMISRNRPPLIGRTDRFNCIDPTWASINLRKHSMRFGEVMSGLKKSTCSRKGGERSGMNRGPSQQALVANCQRLDWDASRGMITHIEMQIRLVRDYEVVALAKAWNASRDDLLSSDKVAFARLGEDRA